nr:hypothetical protein [Tanacetum cinerariifolium]
MDILLLQNAFRFEERRSDLPTSGKQSIPKANWKKSRGICGRPEAKAAFKQMKMLIAELPMLIEPMEKEELIVYLADAQEVVSAVLMTEREAKQMPVYFISRTLQDFIVKWPKVDSATTPMEVEEELLDPWTLFMDGSSCIDSSGAGLIFRFNATNNEAEYEVLIAGLRIAEQMEKVRTLASSFKKFSIKQAPRSENKKADALCKITSTSFAHLTKQVIVEELSEKSINEAKVLAVVEEEGDT